MEGFVLFCFVFVNGLSVVLLNDRLNIQDYNSIFLFASTSLQKISSCYIFVEGVGIYVNGVFFALFVNGLSDKLLNDRLNIWDYNSIFFVCLPALYYRKIISLCFLY